MSPKGSRHGLLKFDDGKSYFKVLPLSPGLAVALQHQIDWGKECLRQCKKRFAVFNVPAAKTIVDSLREACPMLEGACKNDAYLRQWLNRCAVMFCMKFQGFSKMNVTNTTVKEFLTLDFPDEKDLVLPLLTKSGLNERQALYTPLTSAFQHLGYTGPAELFHMYACLFSNPNFMEVIRSKPPHWIENNLLTFQQWAEKYYDDHGIYPHPRQIVQKHLHLP